MMASTRSEPEPSTSVINSNVAFINTGSGTITTRDVYITSSSLVDEFPLPQRITTFHGREHEMRTLFEAFFNQQNNKVVICGLGGFGKSELSTQFAHQCLVKEKVQRVVWIASENPNELQESYKKLAPIYKICADEQLLIVFDNCVNQQSIAEYEPNENKNYRVLITSQYKLWRRDVKIIELPPLSFKSAMGVFKSILGVKYKVEDKLLYKTLASSVSYIPLGLQIIAAYIEQEDDELNLTDYVNEIEKYEENIINETIPDCAGTSYNKSIYSAMSISLNKIKNHKLQIRKLAHDVLCCSAYLEPDEIRIRNLLSLVNMIKKNEYKDSNLKKALKLLIHFSFLRYGDDKKSYLIQHRVTQAFVRYYITKSKLQDLYYKLCLEWVLEADDYLQLLLTVSNAEMNVTIVHNFYKNNNKHENIFMFLRELIRRECIECIRTILKNPDELTKEHIQQYNLLAECAKTENEQILEVLLSNVNINAINKYRDTALHVLAKLGNLNGIKFLVTHGADVNVFNAEGDPPLFTFIRYTDNEQDNRNWDDVFQTFMSDYSVTNSNNQTLLHVAAVGRKTELVDILIKKGLEVNKQNFYGWTPLDFLCERISYSFYNYNVEILKKLLTVGAKSNIKHITRSGDTCEFMLLNYALNDLDLMELMLNNGVDINSRNRHGQTILHSVTELNLKATQILIQYNANPNVKDSSGDIPLFSFVKNIKCIDNNNMDLIDNMLRLLQCNPRNPEHVDSSGNRVLHIATRNHHVELVELLLTRYGFGLNVNRQNSAGETPLHALISSLSAANVYHDNKENIVSIIRTLKIHNARLDKKNKLKETPLVMLQRICSAEQDIIDELSPYLI